MISWKESSWDFFILKAVKAINPMNRSLVNFLVFIQFRLLSFVMGSYICPRGLDTFYLLLVLEASVSIV